MTDKTESNVFSGPTPAEHKFKHKEHIIQNALGGRLKSEDILCEECGNILNKEVDTEFNRLFALFTEKLKDHLAKERNSKTSTAVRGMHIPTRKGVIFQDKEIYPSRPEYIISEDEKTVRVYARKKAMANFRKHVSKDMASKGYDSKDYTIVEITQYEPDQDIALFFSEGVENFNEKWSMGFIKIATEFAYLHGIPREQLTRTLDTKNNKLIHTHNVIPYVPIGLFDFVFENSRYKLETDYPSHTLILFSQKYNKEEQSLYCYVDLFSTFQFYVILNDRYIGKPVYEVYAQKAQKEQKQPIDFKNFRPKHLQLVAGQVGIDLKKYQGKGIDGLYKFLEEEYARIGADYSIDISRTLFHAITQINRSLMLKRMKRKYDQTEYNFSNMIDEALVSTLSTEMESELIFDMHNFLNEDDTVKTEYFRQVFLSQDQDGRMHLFSTVREIMRGYNRYTEAIQVYGHMKFERFAAYTNDKMETENTTDFSE